MRRGGRTSYTIGNHPHPRREPNAKKIKTKVANVRKSFMEIVELNQSLKKQYDSERQNRK